MDSTQLRRIFGLLAFLIALTTYVLTVQDSVPFWDCSEFSSAAIWQQVPHPPGAPLFLMIGKLFDVFIPFGDPGWKINMVSAVSSAVVIWLLFEITVMVIKNLNKNALKDFGSQLATYGSALVGAAAFTFSDTFWFNAVESEVYAMSTLFVAIIIYLMMKWNENADEPGHERYLLLIAYLIGLSTGVHLLAVLCIPPVVYMVYFRKYKFQVKSLIITTVIAGVIFYLVYPAIVKWIPALLAGHTPWRTPAREYLVEDSLILSIMVILTIIGSGVGLWYGYITKNKVLNLACSSFLLIIIGYTTYTQILIRANSHPPMNENYPADFTKLASYLGREQYGDDASWPRRVKTEPRFTTRYQQKDSKGEYIYGPWVSPGRKIVTRKNGEQFTREDWNGRVSLFKNPDVFMGEMMYLWKYQMVHMYWRYFSWNFLGRDSDVQDAHSNLIGETSRSEALNKDSGYKDMFPITFFLFPVLFGIIGFVFHFSKNPKTASVYLLLFLLMGVLAAVAQQQQDPQPRERDYFYTGSFLIWAMWIGMGVYSIIMTINEKKVKESVAAVVILISLILVPANMAYGGWELHDRTGNFIPFDYSYNILQSAEQDAIIFTNGDNDTFPVWYLQDVMGVRRDIRIVNLSLGNTLWYVNQMKNDRPWGAKKLPLSFSDASIQVDDEMAPEALTHIPVREDRTITIPVKKEILEQYTDNQQLIDRGTFIGTCESRPYGTAKMYRVQDLLIMDILEQTKWERPVYFSTTVGPDAYIGLDKFFRVEGMCMRICPVPQPTESIDFDIMEKCLMNVDNSNDYSKEFQYGFKLRNLNNSGVYLDPVHRGLTMTYRELYTTYAKKLLTEKNDKTKALEVLNKMNELISVEQFPMPFYLSMEMSEFYGMLGDKENEEKFSDLVLKSCMEMIKETSPYSLAYREVTERKWGPFRMAADLLKKKEDFIAARDVLNKSITFANNVLSSLPQVESNRQTFELTQIWIIDAELDIAFMDVEELKIKGKLKEAQNLLNSLKTKYSDTNDPKNLYLSRKIHMKELELNFTSSVEDTVVSN